MYTQSAYIRWDGRQVLRVQTNSLRSNKVRQIHKSVHPKSQIVGVGNWKRVELSNN